MKNVTTHNTVKNTLKFFGAALLGSQLIACAGLQKTPSSGDSGGRGVAGMDCTIPSTLIAQNAFQEAKSALDNSACHYRFEAIFEQLKMVSAGNPGAHNKPHFADFINWSSKEGIITKKQASHLYNGYFGEVFVSLPEQGNICSHNDMQPLLDKELTHKREGMVTILGETASFNTLFDQYEQLSLVLDVAQQACQS